MLDLYPLPRYNPLPFFSRIFFVDPDSAHTLILFRTMRSN
jgi:hypothetical protein